MINFILKQIKKRQIKKTFKQYGFRIETFPIPEFGNIEFAQWLHPFETPKKVSLANIQFYKHLTHEGGMIIDIGAHTGDTTVPMALAVGKNGLVLGLEPNPYVYDILTQNARLNPDVTNIVPLCFAATKEDGSFIFNYSDASFCNGGLLTEIENKNHHHNYELRVIGKNLQNYLMANFNQDLPRLNLIKIDAEGFDKEIIKTIPEILRDFKPALMVECYKRLVLQERFELFDLLTQFDYSMFYLENFDLTDKLTPILRKSMNDRKHFEILALHNSKLNQYKFEYQNRVI